MSFQIVLSSLLVLHLAGITLMAGITLSHFFTLQSLNKNLMTDRVRSLSIVEGLNRLSPLIGVGGLLIILSGSGLVMELKDAVAQAIWFKLKMPLVAIMIINGAFLSKRMGHRLQQLLMDDRPGNQALSRLRLIYSIEVLLICIIFILSIFKFR
jgi:hypothetical protein